MKFLPAFFCFFLLFIACKKVDKPNDSANEVENTLSKIEQSIIPVELLERAKASIEIISSEEFEQIEHPEASFQKVRELCEASKGYSNDVWEGVNECSWAVEKERIKLQSEFVSRKEDQLILKMEKHSLSLEHNPEAPAGSTFYQFKSYEPKSKYFLIDEMISGKCIRSKLINAENSNQYNVKGTLLPSGDGINFIAYYPKIGPSPLCIQKLESYTLKAEGLHKNWHIPLNNKIITGIKYPEKGKLFVSVRSKNKTEEPVEYLQLTWH